MLIELQKENPEVVFTFYYIYISTTLNRDDFIYKEAFTFYYIYISTITLSTTVSDTL